MDALSLINAAADRLNPITSLNRSSGDVAAAILAEDGEIYFGVCIDTACSLGFCAEAAAVGAMITNGESVILRVVAVTRDDAGTLQVLSPCGRCREFMRLIDERNFSALVVLGPDSVQPLRSLLPHPW